MSFVCLFCGKKTGIDKVFALCFAVTRMRNRTFFSLFFGCTLPCLIALLLGGGIFSSLQARKGEPETPPTGTPSVAKTEGPRVLVFSKTNGFRHNDAIFAGKKFFEEKGKIHGFTPVFSEDASIFTDTQLQKFDAIVLLCTAGEFTMDVPPKKAPKHALEQAKKVSAERREAFRKRIAAGAALVGLHAATDNFKIGGAIGKNADAWPEYARIIGGAFQHHPQHQTSTIQVVDSKHVSTKHLPEKWTVFDEWYDFKELQRDNHVLLTVADKSVKNAKVSHFEDGQPCATHPLAWTRFYGKGRVFYTARGHYGKAFSEPEYAQHVLGGLFWALGKP